jgi:hypothetical protein
MPPKPARSLAFFPPSCKLGERYGRLLFPNAVGARLAPGGDLASVVRACRERLSVMRGHTALWPSSGGLSRSRDRTGQFPLPQLCTLPARKRLPIGRVPG